MPEMNCQKNNNNNNKNKKLGLVKNCCYFFHILMY